MMFCPPVSRRKPAYQSNPVPGRSSGDWIYDNNPSPPSVGWPTWIRLRTDGLSPRRSPSFNRSERYCLASVVCAETCLLPLCAVVTDPCSRIASSASLHRPKSRSRERARRGRIPSDVHCERESGQARSTCSRLDRIARKGEIDPQGQGKTLPRRRRGRDGTSLDGSLVVSALVAYLASGLFHLI